MIRVRSHGASGAVVIVLHGGPAAAGEAAPIARALADSFRVFEPWQRGSEDVPLTVARHVEDLHEVVETASADFAPALVGESWGAMLALAYAAAHPDLAGPIVLIGCGTFDPASRQRMRETLDNRTDPDLKRRLDNLEEEIADPGKRAKKRRELTEKLYLFDPIESDSHQSDDAPFDLTAHTETWEDMLRLQAEGVYPAAFAAIKSPVLMLHGRHDPHPGQMIRASLERFLPQLEYRELDRCGHSPWLEKHVAEEFFAVLRTWLSMKLEHSSR